MATTRPAPQHATSAAPGCPYLLVAVSSPSLRQAAPLALVALVYGPVPIPPARGKVIEVEGYEAPTEAA